jgi:uncharacterized membrane protein YgaE (UPF0421/DUF939 family)
VSPASGAERLRAAVRTLRGRLETPLVHAAKTAVASGFAWFVAADLLGNQIPVFAPLAAVLTVQVTIWQSVARGLQRVAGVMVGVLVAGAFARVAGIHAWTIALVIFVSLLVGRALRLGTQGAIQVPISALLCLVLGATTGGYGLDRVVDTAVGAACGILVNLVVFPGIHLEEAGVAVRALAEGMASVLREVATRIDGGEPPPDLPAAGNDALLAAARQLADRAAAAAEAVGRADESRQWHPAGRRARPAVETLGAAVAVLAMVERQVRGIARTVTEAGPRWGLPTPPSAALGRLLRQVAGELDEWAPLHAAAGAASTPPVSEPEQERIHASLLSALHDPGLDPHTAALAMAIAVDARRIREELRAPLPSSLPSRSWRSLFDQTGP